MRALRRTGKIGLIVVLTVIFTAVQLIPKPGRPAYADSPAPPAPVPEDPLGQQPEQQTSEISTSVDVRDGHPTVRVVDIWGPGRTPLVVRSYTNSLWGTAGNWQFAHDLRVLGTRLMEPDGNQLEYKLSSTRWNPTQTEKWDVYVRDIGTYSTMEMHYINCVSDPGGPQSPQRPRGGVRRSEILASSAPIVSEADLIANVIVCDWDGTHVVYGPKGVVRRYSQNLIQQVQDANGNVTTFTWTSFPNQIKPYISTVRDPVGREITYGYEQWKQECVQETDIGICVSWKWYYRVRTATDPYGRSVLCSLFHETDFARSHWSRSV